MTLISGYLVVYFKNDIQIASLYDAYLNFINDFDPLSEEAKSLIENSTETNSLADERWEYMFDELSPAERSGAKVYKLEHEVLSIDERGTEITIANNSS
ncbi:MAG: hypothetical protein ACAH07_01065 [Methylophilaceae bacterium]